MGRRQVLAVRGKTRKRRKAVSLLVRRNSNQFNKQIRRMRKAVMVVAMLTSPRKTSTATASAISPQLAALA